MFQMLENFVLQNACPKWAELTSGFGMWVKIAIQKGHQIQVALLNNKTGS